MSQGGRVFQGVVPELVHSLDPAIWGQTVMRLGVSTWQPSALTAIPYSDNAPKNCLLDVELKPKSHWSVRLGAPEWAKYTYERPPDDPLQLLGSARRGMQSGALAKLGDQFVLVGDHVTPLSHADNKQLAAVTAHAKTVEPVFLFKAAPVSAAPPVVVIKRRRIPVPQ